MSRVFCDLRSQKTPRGILPLNSKDKKSAQRFTSNTVESIIPPIQNHISQRRTAAWPGGEEREKGRRPSLTPSASLLATLPTLKCPPERKKIFIYSSLQQQKKVPANKDATTSLSYREELHRPEAPQGRTRPLSVTGSPISCDSTLPFQGFSSVASI